MVARGDLGLGVRGVVSRRGVLAGGAAVAAGLAVPGRARAAVPGAVPPQRATIVPPLAGQHRTLPGGRTYWLSGSGPALVVGIHGTALSASNINAGVWDTGNAATTGWQRHAAGNGYILALAEAADGSWNVGGGWPSGGFDDLAYLLQVVADAAPAGPVYAAGFSAGAAMAWRCAADRPDVFAAAGQAGGWAPSYPAHPVDVWHLHGDADGVVPIRGGHNTSFNFTFPAAYAEAARAARGSRVVLEPLPGGGHATPGWTAGRWADFFFTGR